ncbi:MAG: DNA/RNA non-specific endonuclease [Daejeonella sp.]
MKNILYTAFVFFFISETIFTGQNLQSNEYKKVSPAVYTDSIPSDPFKSSNLTQLEIPGTKAGEMIIIHKAYTLSYNEKYKQANWVAYELTSEETRPVAKRSGKFYPDPQVKTNAVNDRDYSKSGYDRGHLAPAADMGWSAATMIESFYYTNMSPQNPSFNKGIWKRLEELVRTWAIEKKSVYIATGPVLEANLSAIGPHKVAVPRYFYKVILNDHEPHQEGIGFIIPNIRSTEPLQHFVVSIDSVEKFTGIDFFPRLPEEKENRIESNLSITSWSWKISQSNQKKKTSSVSVQCSAKTKAGLLCKRMTKSLNGKCMQHGGN